jgi:hypothetical protein
MALVAVVNARRGRTRCLRCSGLPVRIEDASEAPVRPGRSAGRGARSRAPCQIVASLRHGPPRVASAPATPWCVGRPRLLAAGVADGAARGARRGPGAAEAAADTAWPRVGRRRARAAGGRRQRRRRAREAIRALRGLGLRTVCSRHAVTRARSLAQVTASRGRRGVSPAGKGHEVVSTAPGRGRSGRGGRRGVTDDAPALARRPRASRSATGTPTWRSEARPHARLGST